MNKVKSGTFNRPKSWRSKGVAGDIYYYQGKGMFFKLKRDGNPSDNNWYFPTESESNRYWDWVGYFSGTMFEPKIWREYGVPGCIYYEEEYGYLRLKKEGNPSENKWYFPSGGKSNEYWDFISFKAGNPVEPKYWQDEGQKGDYYIDERNGNYFIFKTNGTPSAHHWYFPEDGRDNEYWHCMGKVTKARWLNFIDGKLPINQISLPGTHDSATGTYSEGIGDGGIVKTQDESVYEQLKSGVRFIDARCRHISNSFAMHHGIIYLNKMFGDILNECKRFLQENPSEFILMSVKREHTEEQCTRSFQETFEKEYYDSYWWFGEDRFPLLEEVRGKIVLFSRFGGPHGIQTSWKDNATFDIGERIHVQDEYNQTDEVKKWHAIRDAWYFSADRGKPEWMTINFTSIAPEFWGTTSIRDYAEDKNPELATHIMSRGECCGVVVSDFHNIAMLSNGVITTNFRNILSPARGLFLAFLLIS
ncbi:phosphatidylinositol-specific phospholipase C [Morganella morganii]|nr:phosphatidylinositol-specific phospholipase C [Morganella morganii]